MGRMSIKLFSTFPRLHTSLLTALQAVCGLTVLFRFLLRPERPTQLESLDPRIFLANEEALRQPLRPRMQVNTGITMLPQSRVDENNLGDVSIDISNAENELSSWGLVVEWLCFYSACLTCLGSGL